MVEMWRRNEGSEQSKEMDGSSVWSRAEIMELSCLLLRLFYLEMWYVRA